MDLADGIDVAEATTLTWIRETLVRTTEIPHAGMKRPRQHLLPSLRANKCPRKQYRLAANCAQCRHLLEEISELKQSNALFTEQLQLCRLEAANAIQYSEAPRPGEVPKADAEKHQV